MHLHDLFCVIFPNGKSWINASGRFLNVQCWDVKAEPRPKEKSAPRHFWEIDSLVYGCGRHPEVKRVAIGSNLTFVAIGPVRRVIIWSDLLN